MKPFRPSAVPRPHKFEETMLRTLVLLAVLCVPSVASAQDRGPAPGGSRGTDEDQRACGPDARRLCRPFLGNDMAVLSCFQQNQAKLSRACRAVLVKYGQL
jgi:hypothetical protein